ncbi:Beta-barrel assembly-enhancing protease [Usitatibacter rugosus]|uniref:Beta-barrel assembly-enhancing protease n=1 Tax=Usitatibacter rugosus TaxID=2732067 RepID=A0A6M4GS87_9PROT|nr:tetratricopeptide repeat protein [Usitatibacter rugosus]QJR09334.1 Beta-barrel assembly-enhancing protease [Usitatibacter rugosus]
MAARYWIGICTAFALAIAGPAKAAADSPDVPVEQIYEFLKAEVAAQRGDLDQALAIYSRIARETRDPQVARRAVEAAVRARAYGPALEAAALLLEVEPDSSLAREIIASLLANDGALPKAQATLEDLLKKSPDRASLLRQLSHLYAKFPDKTAVLDSTIAVTQPYLDMPEAHYAMGVAALLAGRTELATRETSRSLEMRPGWEQAAILQAQVLRKTDAQQVIPYYANFVSQHPESKDVRTQLGRELASERKLSEAREQFRAVEKLAPTDAQPAYAVGLLSLQMEDYDDASAAFKRALDLNYRDSSAVYLSLGQAAEGRKNYDEAIEWYRKVESGEFMRAQLKIATLVAKQQGLAAGREYLKKVEPRSDDDRIQIVQVEAQLLRDAKAWKETYEMLSAAVKEYPDSYELLYDRAMAAERIDNLPVAEADLRKVIRLKPDYAHAYNALGYTLAEKTNRLAEARTLIEQAVKLAPDDPFILDSLGWVNYRQGNLEEALKVLQNAYSQRPDPEIAAHLGEVLWKIGQRDEARKVWRTALAENPEHETLLAVIQKFKP